MKLFVVCPECNLEPILRDLAGSSTYFATSLGISLDSDEIQASIQHLISMNAISEIGVALRESCQIIRPFTASPTANFRKVVDEESDLSKWVPDPIVVQLIHRKISALQELTEKSSSRVVGGLIVHKSAKACHEVFPRFQ